MRSDAPLVSVNLVTYNHEKYIGEAIRSVLRQTVSDLELVVVDDSGGVYRNGSAWIMCLYALREYREWSLRLATPALFPLARQAFAL